VKRAKNFTCSESSVGKSEYPTILLIPTKWSSLDQAVSGRLVCREKFFRKMTREKRPETREKGGRKNAKTR
jgi:hypothetical protein